MSGPTIFEQIGRAVLDAGWYILFGVLGVLGMVGKHFFGKVQNSVSREELKEHLEQLEQRNTQRIETCHKGLKAETDYVKGKVDEIYLFLLKGSHAHRRTGDNGNGNNE